MHLLEIWIQGDANSPEKTGFFYALFPFETGFAVFVMFRKRRKITVELL